LEGFGLLDAAVGWVVGLATAVSGLWVYRHTAKRDAFQDHCSSYKERIAMREKELEQAIEGPDKHNKRRRLSELCDEYDQFLAAWQQKQELASLVRPTAIIADAPRPAKPKQDRIRLLADGSARLPPEVLSAEDYFVRGNAYYEAGDYEPAVGAYDRALELIPDVPEILNNRGNALDKLGRNEEALRDYTRALELRPDRPGTLYNRGIILRRLGRYEDALNDYDRALELEPDNPDTLNNRGFVLDDVGRYDDALKDYDRALELSPDHSYALNNRGVTMLKVERYGDALDDFNRALELKPDYPEALNNRGLVLAKLGHYEEALTDIDRALELNPTYFIALVTRAETNALWGRSENAIRDLEAAIKGDQALRDTARMDQNFEKLRNDLEYGPRFWEIVGKEDNPDQPAATPS
jgi:tetratricopeptide (TPR) repeat protein